MQEVSTGKPHGIAPRPSATQKVSANQCRFILETARLPEAQRGPLISRDVSMSRLAALRLTYTNPSIMFSKTMSLIGPTRKWRDVRHESEMRSITDIIECDAASSRTWSICGFEFRPWNSNLRNNRETQPLRAVLWKSFVASAT